MSKCRFSEVPRAPTMLHRGAGRANGSEVRGGCVLELGCIQSRYWLYCEHFPAPTLNAIYSQKIFPKKKKFTNRQFSQKGELMQPFLCLLYKTAQFPTDTVIMFHSQRPFGVICFDSSIHKMLLLKGVPCCAGHLFLQAAQKEFSTDL